LNSMLSNNTANGPYGPLTPLPSNYGEHCCTVVNACFSPERIPTSSCAQGHIAETSCQYPMLTASLFNMLIDEEPEVLAGVRQLLIGEKLYLLSVFATLSKNYLKRKLSTAMDQPNQLLLRVVIRFPRKLIKGKPFDSK